MNFILVTLAAFIAGAVNAVAGGGTFLAFPSLTGFAGLTERAANISCTIGLWPGSAASVAAARARIVALPRRTLVIFLCLCLTGGMLGSILLLETKDSTFKLVVPWLLLFATLIFAMGQRVAAWAGRSEGHHSRGWTIFVACVQFIIAIYGGYFGAGIGVLTLAGLSLMGIGDIKIVNAMKVALSTATNLSAAVIFLVLYPVPWKFVMPMAIASAVGGYLGMHASQRLPTRVLRGIILTIGITLTAIYFYKEYGHLI